MRVKTADRTLDDREWAAGTDSEYTVVAPDEAQEQQGVVVEALPSGLY